MKPEFEKLGEEAATRIFESLSNPSMMDIEVAMQQFEKGFANQRLKIQTEEYERTFLGNDKQ